MNRRELLAWTLRVYTDGASTAEGRILADALEEAGYPNAGLLRKSRSRRLRRDFDDAIRWLCVGEQVPGSPVDRWDVGKWLAGASLVTLHWRDETQVADAVLRDFRRNVPRAVRSRPWQYVLATPDYPVGPDDPLPLWIAAALAPLRLLLLVAAAGWWIGGQMERFVDWVYGPVDSDPQSVPRGEPARASALHHNVAGRVEVGDGH